MLRLFFPSIRKLHRELAQERRRNKALQETCVDLRNYQERLCSDLRFLRGQTVDLNRENENALTLVTQLRAQLNKKNAPRARDEHGRFV